MASSKKIKETSVVDKILETPWHFAGLTIVFILNGYFRNPLLFNFSEVLLYAVVSTLISIGIFLAFKRVLMLHYAGLMTSLVVFFFFTYGNFDQVATKLYVGNLALPVAIITYLPLIVIAILLTVFALLALQKRQFVQVTTLLNVIAITMLVGVVFDGFKTVSLLNNIQQNTRSKTQVDEILLPEQMPERFPDVYYIILDAYSSNSFLKSHFGIDNSDFTRQLEDLGFFIAEDSLSNYTTTITSLTSSLNMQWTQELTSDAVSETHLSNLIMDSLIARTFQEIGYKYVVVAGGYLGFGTIADLIIDVNPNAELEYFEKGDPKPSLERDYREFLYESTFLRAVEPSLERRLKANSPFGRQRLVPQFEALKIIVAYEEPTFTFFHLVKPHEPLVFNADGSPFFWAWEYPNLMDFFNNEEIHVKAQIDYLNQVTLDTIRYILDNSEEPPIIIIQGDHGGLLRREPKQKIFNSPIAIMNAYYFPDGDYSNISSDIRPINTFRTIFNQYFNIPYEILPNISYFRDTEDDNNTLKYYRVAEGEVRPPYSHHENTGDS